MLYFSVPFQIVMVFNKKTGKPRGYAFVEYEHERDMQCKWRFAKIRKVLGYSLTSFYFVQ
jgi:hypothetical protein